jgi:hypothetical protein
MGGGQVDNSHAVQEEGFVHIAMAGTTAGPGPR